MMGGKLSETCGVVIPINLEFSASVGFIHKDFVAYFIPLACYLTCPFSMEYIVSLSANIL
jgi:hypothetical protein